MNSRQMQYAILLAQHCNFSQVASMLNISQPALSKQILKLEEDLGIKLFDRSNNTLTLTPAGEHFISEAKEILYKEDQLISSLQQYKSGQAGRLKIGITPFRSTYLVSDMIKKIREKYPDITVNLYEVGSELLRKEAAEGKLDFAIVNLPVDETLLDIVPLEQDKIVLALPKSMKHLINTTDTSDGIDFKDCENIPFTVLGKTQEMRILFNKLCINAGIKPIIAIEAVNMTTAWALAKDGVAATILPMQFAKNIKQSDDLMYINIKNINYARQPVIVTKKGQYLSEAAKTAIEELAKNNFPADD